MKKLSVILISLMLVLFAEAQEETTSGCAFPKAFEVMHGNQIRTNIYTKGYFFERDKVHAYFDVPYAGPGSPTTIFASAIWITGKDDLYNVKLAANTYARENSNDFTSGPLSDSGNIDSSACGVWDTIWSVSQFEIIRHLNDFNDNGIVDNPTSSIFGWPGSGNVYFQGINGFDLPAQNGLSAPFYDGNNNNIYEPDLGEYPHPRNVDPQTLISQILWCVYNDAGDVHSNSKGDQLKVDIQQTTYVFHCAEESQLDFTLFSSFRVRNRSQSGLNDVIFGHWSDYDIGCFIDDFVGSNPQGNSAFAYNQDSLDGNDFGACPSGSGRWPTYGNKPPVQSCTFLNREMSSMTMYVNASPGNWPVGTYDPVEPEEFYNLLTGLWSGGDPIYTKGIGFMTDTTETTKFIYHGDPRDSNSWAQSNYPPLFGDQRVVISSEIGTLENGEYADIDMAYAFHRDTALSHMENIGLMYDQVEELHLMYDSKFKDYCNELFIECDDDCVYPGDVNHDGIVNDCDYLELFGATDISGTTRNGPLSWTPHYSENWDTTSPQGYNLKHADCNADGLVDSSDINFIDLFYGLTNPYYVLPGPNKFGDDLKIILNDTVLDFPIPGSLHMRVIFENINYDSLMGITFSLNFDPRFIYRIVPRPSPLFKTEKLFSRETGGNGLYTFTWVRKDRTNEYVDSSMILEPWILLDWVTIPENIRDTTSIKIINAKGILANGELVPLYGDSLDIVFRPQLVSIEETISNKIEVFPNPSNGTIYVKGDHLIQNSDYILYDLNGRITAKGKLTDHMLVVDVAPGLYILNIPGPKPKYAKLIFH